MQAQNKRPLTNLQMQILQVFDRDLPDEELLKIKQLVSDYLIQSSLDKIDGTWDEKGYTNQQFDEILNTDAQ